MILRNGTSGDLSLMQPNENESRLDYSNPLQSFRILINVFSSYYSGDLFLAFSQDNPKIGPIDIIMTFLFRIVIVCTLLRNHPLLLSRTHWVMTNPSSISNAKGQLISE